MKRVIKQLVIAAIFFGILGGIGFGAWWLFVPKAPAETCFDGIKNQNEVDVDCGGVCPVCPGLPEVPKILEIGSLPAEEGGFDLFAKIENVNTDQGIVRFSYTFSLFDNQEVKIAERSGKSFLLPKQTRFLVENALRTPSGIKPQRVELRIPEDKISWVRTLELDETGLIIKNQEFKSFVTGPEFHKANGITVNRSALGYDQVEIVVVVLDKEGKIIGVRKTEQRTLRSQESRAFGVSFRYLLPQSPGNIIMEAYTNLLDPSNILRPGEELERFRELRESQPG